MAIEDFFHPRPPATPTIYALAGTHPDHAELLKVGYTARFAVYAALASGTRDVLGQYELLHVNVDMRQQEGL